MEGQAVETSDLVNKPEVSVQEVRKMVSPEGVCTKLDCVRVNKKTLQETVSYLEDAGNPSLASVLGWSEARVADLKLVIVEVLENDKLLETLAHAESGTLLTQEEIKRCLQLSNLPRLERAFCVLNYNIDPELIPFELARRSDTSAAIADLLTRSEFLRRRLTVLISNPEYQKKFAYKMPDAGYPDSMADEINGFVNNCASEMTSNSQFTNDQIKSTREYLENFFGVRQGFIGAAPVVDFIKKLESRTLEVYFESRSVDALGGDRWFPFGEINRPSIDFVKEHAKAVDKGKYLLTLFQRVKGVYRDFFGEVFAEPLVEKLRMTDPQKGALSTYYESCELANGGYDYLDRAISIESGTVMEKGGAEAFAEETFIPFAGAKVRRRVADVLTMWHEQVHGAYANLVLSKASVVPSREEYAETASKAIDEGFAVIVELLGLDVLRNNPHLFDLDAKDLEDLNLWKRSRIGWLKEKKNEYTEGTYWILYRIFSKAAGSGDKWDMKKGLTGNRGNPFY